MVCNETILIDNNLCFSLLECKLGEVLFLKITTESG